MIEHHFHLFGPELLADIAPEYADNKHGAPNAAAPKVFMKYFFVNTKTGEKSGEMLTLVSLDEDAPVEGE